MANACGNDGTRSWQHARQAAFWLLALLVQLAPGAARANEVCGAPDEAGIRQCHSGLDAAQIMHMRASQEKSQWCWAASIAMVFSHHGFEVAQEEIVRQQYSDAADQRLHATQVAQVLERPWKDSAGRPFHASVTTGSAPARRFLFRDDTVIRELQAQRPLIVGALGHAMVLVQVNYERFTAQDAVRITGGVVIDPTPGTGVRPLTRQELNPAYVAAVQVSQPQQLAAAASATTTR
ncbi:MAG: papain-like cysteine protease family protein [Ramlibacter sp.]